MKEMIKTLDEINKKIADGIKSAEEKIIINGVECCIRKSGFNFLSSYCGYINMENIEEKEVLRKIFSKKQEITFDAEGIIGFDTVHYYNTSETSSYEYVKEQLEKILKEYMEELEKYVK